MFVHKSTILFLIYFFATLENVDNSETFDTCLLCNHIIELAENHYHRDEPEDFVLKELETECLYVGEICGGRSAVMYCIDQVKKNIDTIYNDFKKKKKPQEICQQLGDCK